jgi:hypothetical protein
MKCKHCKLEVHYEGGYLEEEGTGSKQCFANKIKTAGQSFHGHEPAEPEVATTQATEARPEIHTVGFKPLMGEAVEPQNEGKCRKCRNHEKSLLHTDETFPGYHMFQPESAGHRSLANKAHDKGGFVPPDFDPTLHKFAGERADSPSILPSPVEQRTAMTSPAITIEPEAGSTRPEMPPASYLKLMPAVEQFAADMGIQKWTAPWVAQFAELILHSQIGAASVQQEPPPYWQCPNNESHSLKYGPYLYGTKIKELYCGEGCEVKAVFKSQPAAPRAQGREPGVSDEELLTAAFDGMFYPVDDAVWGIKHNQHIGEILSRMTQARTQPAPKSDDLQKVVVDILSNCANKYCHPGGYARPQQTVINEQIDNAVKILQKFFTALPEATKEEK